MKKAANYKMEFDFEIGEVKRSPCRDCYERGRFPECIADCAALNHFQRVLARTVSCNRDSGIDTHTIHRPDYFRSGI